MAFSYSGNPGTSQHDWIRFMCGDTNEIAPIMSDAEIDWIVSEYGGISNEKMLAVAFRQCATHFACKPTRRKLGPQEETTVDRLTYYTANAEKLEKGLSYSGLPPIPDYQYDKVFEKGMMENV